ncbi:hypothetical protein [Methanosphaera sp.]
MIDWDINMIKQVDEHYNSIFNPQVNFFYFAKRFEAIYNLVTSDGEILPDLFNDITYYTINGINAKYKVLVPISDEVRDEILAKRVVQKANREKALNEGIESYYDFLFDDIMKFIKLYPEWKLLLLK